MTQSVIMSDGAGSPLDEPTDRNLALMQLREMFFGPRGSTRNPRIRKSQMDPMYAPDPNWDPNAIDFGGKASFVPAERPQLEARVGQVQMRPQLEAEIGPVRMGSGLEAKIGPIHMSQGEIDPERDAYLAAIMRMIEGRQR